MIPDDKKTAASFPVILATCASNALQMRRQIHNAVRYPRCATDAVDGSQYSSSPRVASAAYENISSVGTTSHLRKGALQQEKSGVNLLPYRLAQTRKKETFHPAGCYTHNHIQINVRAISFCFAALSRAWVCERMSILISSAIVAKLAISHYKNLVPRSRSLQDDSGIGKKAMGHVGWSCSKIA
jgi:hypothetical protein